MQIDPWPNSRTTIRTSFQTKPGLQGPRQPGLRRPTLAQIPCIGPLVLGIKTLNTVTDTPQVLTSLSGTPKQTHFTPVLALSPGSKRKASTSSRSPSLQVREGGDILLSAPWWCSLAPPDRDGTVDTFWAGGDNGSV